MLRRIEYLEAHRDAIIYGRDEDIAKVFGISKERVRQLIASGLKRLRSPRYKTQMLRVIEARGYEPDLFFKNLGKRNSEYEL